MELSWLTKFRIALAVATGVAFIGVLAWPLVRPEDAFGPVFAGNLTFTGKIILAGLAFLSGFAAYFVAWPYGRELAILAVPSGLGVWAIRSGSVGATITMNPALEQRLAFFDKMRWDSLFWLAIVAIGFAASLLAQQIVTKRNQTKQNHQQEHKSCKGNYLNSIIAMAGSVVIVLFFIGIFLQSVTIADQKLGTVIVQPPTGQIVFAVLSTFAIAGFVVKKFLDAGYLYPIIASALITAVSISIYAKKEILQHLEQNWAPIFFANPVTAILPIQMVAFGTLGSIAGYWLAVRFILWRKLEKDGQEV